MNECIISWNGEQQQQKRTDIGLFVKIENKILLPDIRLEISIKHLALGYFVWSPGVNREGKCVGFSVSALLSK